MNPLIIEISELLKIAKKPFWLAGGYSIDAYLGKKTRAHEDLDFTIKRADQLVFQEVLKEWDLQAADPPGSGALTHWKYKHYYDLPIHNIWCRKNMSSPWELELLFSEFENDEWVYRRNRSIRGKIENFGWKLNSNLMVLAPEIQLLYKSRSKRPKDLQDLENCLRVFDSIQKNLLRKWIITDSGVEHPWVKLI
jgi:hypothetical protein